MADTWHAFTSGATFAANKYMIDVFNANTSAKTISVYRIWWFNNQTAAITGVINVMQIFRTSTSSAGSSITPAAHNTSNTALDAGTTAGTGRTITTGSQFRQLLTSPDEAAVSTLDWDSMQTFVPFAEVWNSGYGDTVIQPLTCRNGQDEGVTLKSVTQTVGNADFEMEFTSA